MPLSVKDAGVYAQIVETDGRPASEAACVVGKRAVGLQHPGIHGNIRCEDCVCILKVCMVVFHLIRKPVKLTCVGDFVNLVFDIVTIHVIFVCCLRCRLIKGLAAVLTETVGVIAMLTISQFFLCIGIGIIQSAWIHFTARIVFISINRFRAVKNGVRVCAYFLPPGKCTLTGGTIQEICHLAAVKLGFGFAVASGCCFCKVIAVLDFT